MEIVSADYMSCRIGAASLRRLVEVERVELAAMVDELDLLRRSGAAKPVSKYTAEFEEAWTLYPSRPGNSKAAAYKAWVARLKAGATALVMIEGTAKYAAYVKAERTEASYIKQAATFYGPGEHFTADWTPTKTRRAPLALADQNAANNAEAVRLLGQPTFFPDDGMTLEAAP